MSDTMELDLEGVLPKTGGSFEGEDVLITGGAGFLGSWLCEALVRSGARVTCFDNLSTGSRRHISGLLRSRNFKFLRGDVSRSVPGRSFDVIVHGASIPAPELYMKSPIETVRANGSGTEVVLELARKTDATVLLLSTSEVYGDATLIPTPESYVGRVDSLGPRACYYESKRYAETLCVSYFKEHSLDVRISRLFNSYGPRLDAGSGYSRVISRFIVQALEGRALTIHGDGNQTRSFCYVSDTVRALLSMLTRNVRGQTINVGSGNEISIAVLAGLVKRITGSESRITHESPRPDDPRRRHPDISKAKRLLGWSPSVRLEDGLARTTEWFRRELAQPDAERRKAGTRRVP